MRISSRCLIAISGFLLVPHSSNAMKISCVGGNPQVEIFGDYSESSEPELKLRLIEGTQVYPLVVERSGMAENSFFATFKMAGADKKSSHTFQLMIPHGGQNIASELKRDGQKAKTTCDLVLDPRQPNEAKEICQNLASAAKPTATSKIKMPRGRGDQGGAGNPGSENSSTSAN